MDEAIYQDAFVLRVDDDGERELTGFVGGPAGVSELQLGASTWLSVDTADPFTLASLRCTRASDLGLLLALVGKDVANRLLVEPPGGEAVRVGRRRSTRSRGPSSLRGGGPEAYELGGAVALAEVASDPMRHELTRGAAALELAAEAASLPLPTNVTEALTDVWLPRAVNLLEAGADALPRLINVAKDAARQLEDLTGRMSSPSVVAGTPQTRRSLAAFGQEVRELRTDEWALAMAAGGGGGPKYSPIDESPTEPQRVLVDLRPAGRLVVHRPKVDDEEGGWLRVLAAGSSTLLTIAPFESVGRRWRADAIVPPDLGLHQLNIDVTDDPLPARTKLEATRRAIRLGRKAVAFEVVRHHRASGTWLRCAAAWRELGDARRAALAEQRAEQPQPGRRAFVADEIHLALAL